MQNHYSGSTSSGRSKNGNQISGLDTEWAAPSAGTCDASLLDGGVLFATANAKAKATVNAKAEAKARPKAKAKGKAKTKAKRSEKGWKNTRDRKGRKRVDTRVREGRQQIRKRVSRFASE